MVKKKQKVSHLVNKKQEKAINALIPQAEGLANVKILKKDYRNHEEWADAWNRIFHHEMGRLAHLEGLRNYLVEI